MRRQETIYAQTLVSGIRNKSILNVSTSSDICVFESPIYDMEGAGKITTGYTSTSDGVHIGSDIGLEFNFTGNTQYLQTDGLKFRFNVYKFDDKALTFPEPAVFTSEDFAYSAFSGTNSLQYTIPLSSLKIDGEFLIKGSFEYNVCTDILKRLGLRNTSTSSRFNVEYNLYDKGKDYYFTAISPAPTPIFSLTPDTDRPLGSLTVFSLFPSGSTEITIEQKIMGTPIVTLNGLVLADEEDYTISGSTLFLNGPTAADDIITLAFVGAENANGLIADTIVVSHSILSGSTDNQGSESVYFNTTSGKYELYTKADPMANNDIMVSINGMPLANNIDYYRSVSNPRRIILEGTILVDDIITIVYNSHGTYVGAVNTSNLNIYWYVTDVPQKSNGVFTLEVASDKKFDNVVTTASTPYVATQKAYSSSITLSGAIGTQLYYRVKSEKNYINISGDVLKTEAYSEIIPITIQSNSLNSY